MTNIEKNCFIYKRAIEYLWEHSQGLTQEILDSYLIDKRKETMNEVFHVAVFSFRDWNAQFAKSGIKEHEEEIKALFKDFDVYSFNQNIATLPEEELDELFKKAFKGSNDKYKNVKENVCDSAKFLSEFKNSAEMYAYFDTFDSTKKEERNKLIRIIAGRIKWWGPALVPNWLKDIGMSNYSKPDQHVIYIISNLGLSSVDEYDIIEAVFRIAEDYKSIDSQASAFKLDRILWLIGSKSRFYNHKNIVTFTGSREEFVEIVKAELNKAN
ncbi:hypothetical protein [Ruminococcus sp. XPD3002]|uniref:hypothetical protein n=1 Tax=Ruminococcus sp. XPD3002 TaxID=1452269 RepID=UPI00091F131A|nr:hypothetical protein SAMN04487832_12714 [Ruminococcus flavefaciens]